MQKIKDQNNQKLYFIQRFLYLCSNFDFMKIIIVGTAAVGFYLSGHLFDEVEAEVRCFVRTKIAELQDSREPQILAGIVSDLRWINGQRGRLALFKLDDKSCAMDVS